MSQQLGGSVTTPKGEAVPSREAVKPWPSVVIVNTDPAVPTYHAHGAYRGSARNGPFRTRCGLVSAYWNADQVPSLSLKYQTAWLRRDHADAIARPCGKCFPSPLSPPKEPQP